MQQTELSPGIFFNKLSDRIATITSKLPNAAPDWRISYFGFDKWHEACAFVARIKRQYGVRAEAFTANSKVNGRKRKMRLQTKAEVKVWGLTKQQVRTLYVELEGHHIATQPAKENPDGTKIYRVYLNWQSVIMIHENQLDRLQTMPDRIKSMTHNDARLVLANEFLCALV